jgi:hypothetical protein
MPRAFGSRSLARIGILIGLLQVAPRLAMAASCTWTGGGADDSWATAAASLNNKLLASRLSSARIVRYEAFRDVQC